MGVKIEESVNVGTPKAQNCFPVAQADNGEWRLTSAGYVVADPGLRDTQLSRHVFCRQKRTRGVLVGVTHRPSRSTNCRLSLLNVTGSDPSGPFRCLPIMISSSPVNSPVWVLMG